MAVPVSLVGKRALITGGSRGLGRHLCLALARAGAKVAFSYRRDQSAAEETARLVADFAEAPRAFRVSVTEVEATDQMVRALEGDWGGLDILINNASVTQNLPLALLEEEDFDHVMDINVKGTYITSRAVCRSMIRAKSGVILNVGSLAGVRMIEAPIHYATSKAAIVGFTASLAKEVARHNVRVLCVAPGVLEGGVGQNLPEHRLKDYLKHNALGRVGTFREVAELCCFLVSDQNSYMNGQTVQIDGGI